MTSHENKCNSLFNNVKIWTIWKANLEPNNRIDYA